MVERNCMILCNFNDKELKLLKTYAAMMGLRDQIIVNYKNGNSVVRDILEDKLNNECTDGIKDRAIIFNNLPSMKVSMFIDNMRKMRIAPAMKAMVTETSIDWTLNHLLENLVEERKAAKLGKVAKHDEEHK